MENLPAYSILIVSLLLSIILIFKFKTEHILSVIEGKNFFLLGTLIIIFSLLTFYLFKPNETWVADLLKIAIGIFAGAGAVAIKGYEKEKGQNSLSLDKSSINGIGNKFAGRDINESISNIEKTFGDIKDSVINQNNKINQLLNSSNQLDHCIHMIYRPTQILEDIEYIVSQRIKEGWVLANIEFAFNDIDGIILLFTRAKKDEVAKLTSFRDRNFEQSESKI